MHRLVTATALLLLATPVAAAAATRQVFRYRALEVHAEWGRVPTPSPPPGFAGEVFSHATIDAGRLRQVEYGERAVGPFTYYSAQTYTYDANGRLVYLVTATGGNDDEGPVAVPIAKTLARARVSASVHLTVCIRQPDASYDCGD